MAKTKRRGDYDTYREKQAAIGRERSEHGREIGPLPDVADTDRRNLCCDDFKLFCETYFPARFRWPWGRDHLEVLGILQQVVLDGGQFPLAMPRGSGKTTLTTCAAIFAVLYGHRRFVVFIASNSKVANDRLDELIRSEFETNELVIADFPEACYPVVRLERNTMRARMQTLDGEFTRLDWGAGELRLPTVPGSACSGARIACAGLATGDIRGLLKRSPDGSLDRPDLVICDDPQTDESARMPGQCDTREALVTGAIMGLAGPGKKLAVVVPCTVIRPNDLSDRLLDRKRNPEWYGRKFRLVEHMPDRMDLWHQYGDLLRDELQDDPPTREKSTAFYLKNRVAMDAGADLPWPARQEPGTVSAVQFAMNLHLLKPAVFAAEYQNEPLPVEDTGGAQPIDPADVAEKLNRVSRGTVPVECDRLTAFLDPKQEIIFWSVVGWDMRFGGAVVDYGAWPRQSAGRFSGTDPSPAISDVFRDRKMGLEARIYAALTAAADAVLGREFPRADGGQPMRVELCLVDAGWGPLSELIHKWARESSYAGQLRASKGVYVGAAKTPFSEWRHQPGDRKGPGWRIRTAGTQLGRLVSFDANHWKTFVAERLRSEMGSPGSLALFGASPAVHGLFCDHLAAEYPVRMTSDAGRTVDEWQNAPGNPDNDWLDCLVGCAVAASIQGLRLSTAADGTPDLPKPKPKPRTYAETMAERGRGPAHPNSYTETMRRRQAERGGR